MHEKIAAFGLSIGLTDAHKAPRMGEQVLFKAKKTGKFSEGRTNRSGTLLVTLPAGDEYTVSASMPVADNNTDEGRGKNRRTEVKIL